MRKFSKLLHDKFFTQHGPNADGTRCSGRSTGEALRIISEAMLNPQIPITIFDRSMPLATEYYKRGFVETVQSWINKLDLKYLDIEPEYRGGGTWALTYNIFIDVPGGS